MDLTRAQEDFINLVREHTLGDTESTNELKADPFLIFTIICMLIGVIINIDTWLRNRMGWEAKAKFENLNLIQRTILRVHAAKAIKKCGASPLAYTGPVTRGLIEAFKNTSVEKLDVMLADFAAMPAEKFNIV